MTVSSELNRKQYTGNGVTTSFATSPVVFFDSSDLDVYVVTTATGAATQLTETTDYTVSGGDGSTGTVSLAGLYGAPSAAQTLVIVRNVPLTQAADFVQNDASDAEVVEDALDKLTMADQQLSARLTRSFTLADSDVSGASLTVPTPVAGTLVGWNDAGTALQNYEVGDLDLFTVSTPWAAVIDDASIAAGMETIATALTADTAPAVDDLVFVRSTANTQGRKTTWQNALKVINGLSEDTSPDALADYLVTYDASASAAKKVLPASIARVPSGAARNLTASRPSVSTIDINADELIVRDSGGRSILLSAVDLTVDITASGANGLDTSSEASGTWYYGWVIYNPSTGTTAGLLSTSATSPTLPSGYTFKALVTAARNDGSSNLIAYFQNGNEVFYQAAQNVLNSSSGSTTEQTLSLSAQIPSIAHTTKLFAYGGLTAGGGGAPDTQFKIRHTSTAEYAQFQVYVAASDLAPFAGSLDMPNRSQQLFWLWANVTNVNAVAQKIDVLGFKLPVCGE